MGVLTSDEDWDPDVADQDSPFTAITSGETHEPQVIIEVHTTCHLDTSLIQDEIEQASNPDISLTTRFKFGDYHMPNTMNRGEGGNFLFSKEIACHFVGFSESVGHPMTHKILNV